MSLKDRPQPAEPDAPAVAPWMVTFSDCMTLLLCFFVMMLSFSSFNNMPLDRLAGIFPKVSNRSIFPHKHVIKDSLVQPVKAPFDHTTAGSEKPTLDDPENIMNPKRFADIDDTEAYRDRKVAYISSSRLFHAKGSGLTADGKELLGLVASFIRRLPCNVIISESSQPSRREGLPSKSSEPLRDVAMHRALAVMKHFTETEKLSGDQFSISAASSVSAERTGGADAVEIVLLMRRLHK